MYQPRNPPQVNNYATFLKKYSSWTDCRNFLTHFWTILNFCYKRKKKFKPYNFYKLVLRFALCNRIYGKLFLNTIFIQILFFLNQVSVNKEMLKILYSGWAKNPLKSRFNKSILKRQDSDPDKNDWIRIRNPSVFFLQWPKMFPLRTTTLCCPSTVSTRYCRRKIQLSTDFTSVSDPYSLNPDPAKNLTPDPDP